MPCLWWPKLAALAPSFLKPSGCFGRGEEMARRIVIIGANAAGVAAASFARRTDRKAEITLIEKDRYPGYSRCGLPFAIAGEIPSLDDLVLFKPEWFKGMRLDLRLETEAKRIDLQSRTVEIEDKSGKKEELSFDSLILCTGARAWIPPIEGRDKKGVFMLRTIDDARAIMEALKDAKKAVVIGAGAIGLEMAAAMREKGLEVTIVELLPHVLPVAVDEDVAKLLQDELEEHGVRLILGKPVKRIIGDEHVKAVEVDGEEIEADLILAATGVRANTELAAEAGLAICPATRAIRTDFRLRCLDGQRHRPVEGVYAAGDCAASIHMVTGLPALSQLGTTAVRMGKVAGINAAGGYATFPGVLGSFVTKVFGLEVGSTGITAEMAKRLGIDVVTGVATHVTKAEYYPGGKHIRVKLVVERATKRIVGGQVVGGEDVTQRINLLALAIQARMTVYDLANIRTAYAPPVADVWEPVVLAADVVARRLG